jgi:hypothetical protein
MAIFQNRYTLNDFNNIINTGFNYNLPDATLKLISSLASEVGAPNYVKTPTFQKKDPQLVNNETLSLEIKPQLSHLKIVKNGKQ